MLASFKRFVRYRSALPFGGGTEAFDAFYLEQYNKIILGFWGLGFFLLLFFFSFVQGSVIGPSVELTTLYLCAEMWDQRRAALVPVEGTNPTFY